MKTIRIAIAAAALIVAPAAVSAQDVGKAVAARKAAMQLYAHYISQLGAMAKGAIDYDAEAAGKAAASLNALASLDQSRMWPQGSGNDALGDQTRALPTIWTTYPAVTEKSAAFKTAAAAMNDAAGGGLASLQGAMGALGQSCGGCHEDFRQPKE